MHVILSNWDVFRHNQRELNGLFVCIWKKIKLVVIQEHGPWFFESPSALSRISENFVDNFPIMLQRKVGIFFLQISGVCKMVLRGEVGT